MNNEREWDGDEMPSLEEMKRLHREWRGNATHLPLWEKGVNYEDQQDRSLDDQPPQRRQRDRGHER
ncbi:MAG: hypothetical protein LC104_01625 [Bacteroidales bacterium]|nr:hypothetical protein [Bacteroidales bacterium]